MATDANPNPVFTRKPPPQRTVDDALEQARQAQLNAYPNDAAGIVPTPPPADSPAPRTGEEFEWEVGDTVMLSKEAMDEDPSKWMGKAVVGKITFVAPTYAVIESWLGEPSIQFFANWPHIWLLQ